MFRKNPFLAHLTHTLFRTAKVAKPPPVQGETHTLERALFAACSGRKPLMVYCDTCSLLHSDGEKLLRAVENVFPKLQLQLLIFDSVQVELKHVGEKDQQQRSTSTNILRHLQRMAQSGVVTYVRGENDRFSDVNFIAAFTSKLQKSNILLISQDHALCRTAEKLQAFLSPCIQTPYQITAYHLQNRTLQPYGTSPHRRTAHSVPPERKASVFRKAPETPVRRQQTGEIRFYPTF